MDHAALRLRIFGVCLAIAVAAFAVGAAGAQAEGEWSVEGKTLTELGHANVEVSAELESPFVLEVEAKLKPFTVKCGKLVLDNGLLLKGGEATGDYLYSECQTLIEGKASAACKPAEPLAFDVRSLLLLHKKKVYLLHEPRAGTEFGQLTMGEECVFGEKLPITGSYVTECAVSEKESGGSCEEERVTQLLVDNEEVEKRFEGQEEEGKKLPKDLLFLGQFRGRPRPLRARMRALAWALGARWHGAI